MGSEDPYLGQARLGDYPFSDHTPDQGLILSQKQRL